MPKLEVPLPRVLERARQETLLRSRLLKDFGAYTASQLAELSGSTAGNRSQLAYQWKKHGRIFAVTHQRTPWYLGFQFDEDGRPLPVIAPVIEQLRTWPAWELAAWFVKENGMLDRRRPVDLLTDEPDGVVAAAAYDAARLDPERRPTSDRPCRRPLLPIPRHLG